MLGKRTILTGALSLVALFVVLQAGSSFADDNDDLSDAIQNAPHINVSATEGQAKLIDKVERINEAMERSSSDVEKVELAAQKQSLRPALIENGMMFAKDFHADTEYWTDVLRDNAPLTPIYDNQTPPPAASDASISERDWGDHWFLVHRVYYSCGSDIICDQGLWEYAQDGDWSSVTIEIELESGTYLSLEHEANNLRFYSVLRDFDSYWSHVRDNDIIDNDTEFTTQYWTAFEREIQDGLLTTNSAQDGDEIYSTMRIH